MNLQTIRAKLASFAFLGFFACLASGAQPPVGIWVLDPDETERHLLKHPPTHKLDAGFVWAAGVSCQLSLAVTSDNELSIGSFRETDPTKFIRNQAASGTLLYERVRQDGKVSTLTLSGEGAHIRVDDGASLKHLLWKSVAAPPPRRSLSNVEEMACLTPLDRVWKRYGPRE
jgi:hypothetical protein